MLAIILAMAPLICTSMMAGLFLSVFYKKSFTFRDDGPKGIKWTVLPAILQVIEIIVHDEDPSRTSRKIANLFNVLLAITAFCRTFYILEWSEKIKSVMISSTFLLSSVTSRETLATCAAVVGITQFLRRPKMLKNVLSPYRIMLGPVYVLLMAGAGVHLVHPQRHFKSAFSLTTALSPVIAATLFRPDNFELLHLVSPRGLRIRPPIVRSVHGLLMAYSLFSITLNNLWPLNARFIALANITLYFMFSDFPKQMRKSAMRIIQRTFDFLKSSINYHCHWASGYTLY